ncbi:TetR/AcrR family transcriptional regulator [Archangium lansingense]|uniref:TetR/AcrR family transcriptional regulator n=1 Tax=Archangium lansingense TaxID=2995310 RepID=A0ABT4AN36_9BACT|nr:TetR/AcrR family transcriptional regulator [Archangium lansinium]MCY1083100.1 TetR/AcrR family transcriptional regulator [Archangium lansinium]
MSAAREMVVREGFAALSMRKLAEAIEYAPATLYLHFESREDLARELSVRGFQQLLEFLAPAARVEEPLERLAEVARAYVRFGLEQPETYRLIFMEDPKLTTALFGEGQDDLGAKAFALLVKPLEELKAGGRLAADADTRQLAEVLWAGVHGIVSLKLTCAGFQGTAADVLTTTLVTTFFHGLPGLTGAQRPRG